MYCILVYRKYLASFRGNTCTFYCHIYRKISKRINRYLVKQCARPFRHINRYRVTRVSRSKRYKVIIIIPSPSLFRNNSHVKYGLFFQFKSKILKFQLKCYLSFFFLFFFSYTNYSKTTRY